MQLVDSLRCDPVEQLGRVLAAQPAEPVRLQIRAVEQRRVPFTHGEDDRDRIGDEPAKGEQQRLRARFVEPMSVVDQNRDRSLLGICRREAERSRTDREPLLRQPGPQRQRAFERHGLRARFPLKQP